MRELFVLLFGRLDVEGERLITVRLSILFQPSISHHPKLFASPGPYFPYKTTILFTVLQTNSVAKT